jgi:hypothetical protein
VAEIRPTTRGTSVRNFIVSFCRTTIHRGLRRTGRERRPLGCSWSRGRGSPGADGNGDGVRRPSTQRRPPPPYLLYWGSSPLDHCRQCAESRSVRRQEAEPSLLSLAEGRLSGRLVVRLLAAAPLVLSGIGKGTAEYPYGPVVLDGKHVLPGSQLAGAARSLHEALTDSCLRVIDLDYVPVHRDLAQPQAPGRWRMALVERGGQCVRMCESISFNGLEYSAIWDEARRSALTSRHDRHPSSGTTVLLNRCPLSGGNLTRRLTI